MLLKKSHIIILVLVAVVLISGCAQKSDDTKPSSPIISTSPSSTCTKIPGTPSYTGNCSPGSTIISNTQWTDNCGGSGTDNATIKCNDVKSKYKEYFNNTITSTYSGGQQTTTPEPWTGKAVTASETFKIPITIGTTYRVKIIPHDTANPPGNCEWWMAYYYATPGHSWSMVQIGSDNYDNRTIGPETQFVDNTPAGSWGYPGELANQHMGVKVTAHGNAVCEVNIS